MLRPLNVAVDGAGIAAITEAGTTGTIPKVQALDSAPAIAPPATEGSRKWRMTYYRLEIRSCTAMRTTATTDFGAFSAFASAPVGQESLIELKSLNGETRGVIRRRAP